jgi:hypothetical protein
MEIPKHERFIAANRSLRELSVRADRLARQEVPPTQLDLMLMLARLSPQRVAIGDASLGEPLDKAIQEEIAEYVSNFRVLQFAAERIHDATVARLVRLEAVANFLERLLGSG